MVKLKKTKRYLSMLLIFLVVFSTIIQDSLLVHAASTPAAYPIPSLTGDQRVDAVNIAKSQVGYVEGSGNLNAYGQELGYNGLEWCAYFAIWCTKKAGVEERPTTGSTTANVSWFQNRGLWHNKQSVAWSYNGHGANGVVDSYVPQPGDFAAIENNGSASDGPEHTAFVVAVDDSWVYTVEGNISQSVVERKYSRSNWRLNGSSSSNVYINGFGTINYQTPFYYPKGSIDLIAGGDGTISVRGWAFDKDDVNSNLAIHVYIGGPAGSGATAKVITANKERVDVNSAYPGVGNYHGFESTFSVSNRGNVEVYVYAINVGEGENVLLGSKTVVVTEETPPAKTLPKLTGDQRVDATNIAESQIGYVEGSNDLNIYGKDLGQNGVAWGAYFVLWCLDKAGVEERPTTASTTANITWFQDKGLWHNKQSTPWAYSGHSCNGVVDSNYVPQVGDIIAIESNAVASDGPESTGIVVDIDSSWIYTVEGNVSQSVVARKYSKSSLLLNGTSSTIYINGFGSINYKTKLVTGITLNKTSVSLSTGGTYTLTATVSPTDATNKAVTWKSSNTAVATVDTNGKVTAVGTGSATITATAKDGSGKSASCSVTVTQPVTGITLNKTSVSLQKGGTYTLTATVSPSNATNKAVTWKSSNTAVATVDTNGKVTAVGTGSATVTATAKDGSGKSASCTVTVTPTMSEQERQVRAFTERMYTIVLGRAAEAQGLNDWTERLLAKEIDGATLVDMFVNSDEFVNRNTSDEEYIKILYRAVLGREADSDGLKMWKDMLADDWTRDYILEGLVLSTEFKSICDSYGIIAAFEPTAESQVRSFVKRMYTVVLNRRADVGGLEDWTKQLLNGTVNGAKVADGFINSQEFANRNLSNEKYVKVLYRAFFNREPDEGGFNVWMSELAKGTSRREVMKGFVHSVEFSDLCAAYGIIRGEIQ